MKREKFAQLCHKAQLTPVDHRQTKWGTVLIADGFRNDKPHEYPFGYYRTMWAVERGNLDVGRDLEFEAFHDPQIPIADRQMARINAAAKDAEGWMMINIRDAERYDA